MSDRRSQKQEIQPDRRLAGSDRRRFVDEYEIDKVVNALKDSLAENSEAQQAIEQLQELLRQKDERIEELEAEGFIDNKTQVYNEKALNQKLPALIELARRNNAPIALVLADADGLKRTNETLGHSKGDDLLIASAKALKGGSRVDDPVGRMSGEKGDEFYAILRGFAPVEGSTDEELYEATVDKYRDAIGHEMQALGLPDELKAGVSFGIAILAEEDFQQLAHMNSEELARVLIDRADELLLKNKKAVYQKLGEQGIKFADRRVA